jgi:glycosyltransferase involved in cell wall biosynthesis/GR25 family glycosyltransferase involved in LPS biosynthesis
MSDVAKALEAERSRQFSVAIALYSRLRRRLRTAAFDYNVERVRDAIESDGQRLTAGAFLAAAEVEHVYVLNLASQPQKRIKIARELSRVGIRAFEFVDGIDGWADSRSQAACRAYRERPPGRYASSSHISDETQRVLKRDATLGTFGYLYSQRRIFEDAVRNGYERIGVFDDDVIFVDGYESVLGLAKTVLGNRWSVIQLGASEYSRPHPADKAATDGYYSALPHGTCGSFAVLYDRAIFAEILEAIDEMDGPFDNAALGSVYRRRPGQCHVVYPYACAADVHSSSIRNPRDQFQHAASMRWPLSVERYRAFTAPHVVNIVVREPSRLAAQWPWLQEFPGDLIANAYYLSDDGVRPLHPGRSGFPAQEVERSRALFDEACSNPSGCGPLEGAALPTSDLTVLWPGSTAPTRESLLSCLMAEYRTTKHLSAAHPRVPVVSHDRFAAEQRGLASVIVWTGVSFDDAMATIESVIRQDYGDVEIILVVDNPSMAVDAESIRQVVWSRIVERGRGRRRDFRLIQHSRVRSTGGAWNTGLMVSRGEFASFLVEAERYDEEWLSTAIRRLQLPEGEEMAVSGCGGRAMDPGAANGDANLEPTATESVPMPAGKVMARRDFLMAALGFEEEPADRPNVRPNGRPLPRYRTGYERWGAMQLAPQPDMDRTTTSTSFNPTRQIDEPLINRTQMQQVTHPTDAGVRPGLKLANHLARTGSYEQAIELYERLKVQLPELRETIDFNVRFCAARMTGRPFEVMAPSTDDRPPATARAESKERDEAWEVLDDLGSFPTVAWTQEFGPGRITQLAEHGVSLQSEGARFFFSHDLRIEVGYRYTVRFRVRCVEGNAGEVAAVLIPERRSTLASAPSGSWGSDGVCEVRFGSDEPVTARIRVGIGTTAAVIGSCRLEIDGIEVRRRKVVVNSNPELGAFARQFIDPALRLPALSGLVNDYSAIEDRAKALRAAAGWESLRVSVVISGYGRPDLLRNTLASLCCQDYPRELVQVIVVDDGGDNDDYEQAFFDFDKRLELYLCRQKRDGYGASRARNLGARLATGDVLVFLDSDILLPETFVSELMSLHHVSDDVSVLGLRRFVAASRIDLEAMLAGVLRLGATDRCPSRSAQPRVDLDGDGSAVDWRLADIEATDWLKQSRNPFHYFGAGVSSVAKSRHVAIGGYDECFKEWGGGDEEFAYRLWSRGQYFVPLKDCFCIHQDDSVAPQDRHRRLVESQRTQRLLVERCAHPSVRGFSGRAAGTLVPQFSVYIPAFNTARYIRECVESALAQTYDDFEVVIVDDGSTDGTSDVLESFRRDPRVRLITRANGGIGAASNSALRACRGEYVVQLDSDDVLRSNALATVASHLARHPEIECLYTKYSLIDQNGTALGPGWSPSRFDRYENLVGMSVPHMRVFRRALYHRAGGFDESIVNAVDYDFYLKLSEVAHIHFLDADLYLYRVHGTQTSTAQGGLQIRNHKKVVGQHLERLGLKGFEVSSPNPFEPRKNYISLPGTDFAFELARASFAQTKVAGGLSLPEPKAIGNDYSAMQDHVSSVYARPDAPPYTERVSIVVPVYNRAERLGRCLAGIFHQSYPRDLIEVVIVDDGSSDEVMSVVRKYSGLLDVQYVKQADRGYRLSAARNAGIKAARHRNISIIDCDLIPLREFIESFMRYLHHFDNAVLLGHQRFVDPTGISDDDILADPKVLRSMRDIRSENSTMQEGEGGLTVDWRYALYKETDHLKKDQAPYRAFSSGHVAYRKELIERAGMYDEDFVVWGCEDNEAGYRLYQAGAFFIPVLEAVDLHQEPPSGKNETDRERHRKISRQLLQEKVPATRGWFGKGFERKPGMVPLVTIGVPVHNTGKFAVDAIQSALAQDMQDIEVLVYDDASTDGTLELLQAVFKGDLRVRIIEGREHRNVTYARNEIIRRARGEFVGFLDSDDLLEPCCVRECLAAFRADPGVGLVCTGYSRIDEGGASLGAGWSPGRFNREGLMYGNIFTHFRMFRMRDWSRCRKWDAEALRNLGYGEDWDLCLMLAEVSGFTRIPKPLYKYRVRSSGITQSSAHDYKASQTRWVVQRWVDRLGRRDLEVVSTSRTNPSAIGFISR